MGNGHPIAAVLSLPPRKLPGASSPNAQTFKMKGYGMFIGVELTEGPGSKAPNGKLAKDVVANVLHHGLVMQDRLVMQDGLDNNVLKIKPPMCFTRANADSLLQSLDAVLTNLTQ